MVRLSCSGRAVKDGLAFPLERRCDVQKDLGNNRGRRPAAVVWATVLRQHRRSQALWHALNRDKRPPLLWGDPLCEARVPRDANRMSVLVACGVPNVARIDNGSDGEDL